MKFLWKQSLAAVVSIGVLLASSSALAVNLIGTWYVLIHYQDDQFRDPEAQQWEDHVWEFKLEESRLRWLDYPIVVFNDPAGRFSNRQRIVHAWEPNGTQREQIATGLVVNPRGSKTKTLRGSESEGWASVSRRRAASVAAISYVEHWSVETPATLPVFAREDHLGSGLRGNMEGRTELRTTRIAADGNTLHGEYSRDGVRHGVFRMMRSGAEAGTVQASKNRDGASSIYPIVHEMIENKLDTLAEARGLGELNFGSEFKSLERLLTRLSKEGATLKKLARAALKEVFTERTVRRKLLKAYKKQDLDTPGYEEELDSLTETVRNFVAEAFDDQVIELYLRNRARSR